MTSVFRHVKWCFNASWGLKGLMVNVMVQVPVYNVTHAPPAHSTLWGQMIRALAVPHKPNSSNCVLVKSAVIGVSMHDGAAELRHAAAPCMHALFSANSIRLANIMPALVNVLCLPCDVLCRLFFADGQMDLNCPPGILLVIFFILMRFVTGLTFRQTLSLSIVLSTYMTTLSCLTSVCSRYIYPKKSKCNWHCTFFTICIYLTLTVRWLTLVVRIWRL